MTAEGEARIIELLQRLCDNHPAREDIRFFSADADVAPASSILTVTWNLRTDFEIVVTKMYADARDDCTYEWRYSGVSYEFNQVEFDDGQRVRKDYEQVQLIVTNAGAVDQDVGYYIRGWARRMA